MFYDLNLCRRYSVHRHIKQTLCSVLRSSTQWRLNHGGNSLKNVSWLDGKQADFPECRSLFSLGPSVTWCSFKCFRLTSGQETPPPLQNKRHPWLSVWLFEASRFETDVLRMKMVMMRRCGWIYVQVKQNVERRVVQKRNKIILEK